MVRQLRESVSLFSGEIRGEIHFVILFSHVCLAIEMRYGDDGYD